MSSRRFRGAPSGLGRTKPSLKIVRPKGGRIVFDGVTIEFGPGTYMVQETLVVPSRISEEPTRPLTRRNRNAPAARKRKGRTRT